MKRIFGLLIVFTVMTCATAFAEDEVFTTSDVLKMVGEAIDLIQLKGDDALPIISDKNGKFHKGELYVFVYDINLTVIAHPTKPTLIGTNVKGKPDVKGKFYREELLENTLKNGESWTDYTYTKPGVPGQFSKRSYSKLITNKATGKKYIVCAGLYSK